MFPIWCLRRSGECGALVSLGSWRPVSGRVADYRNDMKRKRYPDAAPEWHLHRNCARLCHDSGGELEQIQFLLGHASVETTERYLGFKQKFREAVNDRFMILGSDR